MQSSSIPPKFVLPFASSAVAPYIRPIPVASQVSITPGAASLETGFPPSNFQPESAGGVPPAGQDFNGLLKQITQWTQWQNAGAQVFWDSAFSASISGYPRYAQVLAAGGTFWWQSTVENNTTNPDAGGAGWRQIVASAPSTSTPLVDGTAAVGVSLNFARGDHVHPTDSSRASLTYVNSTFQTITAADATYLPKINPITSGDLTVNGDIIAQRSGSPNTGLIYLNTSKTRYLYNDSTNYQLPGQDLILNGTPVIATLSATTITANNALARAARAYVSFDGTTGAIQNSFNVTSVTRNGVGDYTINFTSPMASANFSVLAMGSRRAGGSPETIAELFSRATTNARIQTMGGEGTFRDSPIVTAAIFGG